MKTQVGQTQKRRSGGRAPLTEKAGGLSPRRKAWVLKPLGLNARLREGMEGITGMFPLGYEGRFAAWIAMP